MIVVNFSIFTFISTQLIISLLIILIFLCMRNNTFICRYGIYFILMPLLACLFRAIFPFETSYTIVLPSFNILTKIYDIYNSTFMGYKVSSFLYLTSIIGSVISAVLLIKDFHSIHVLTISGINIHSSKSIMNILKKIQKSRGYNIDIKIILCNNISTPFIFGYFSPTIYLPNINYSDTELYYILDHELIHWVHKDLWLKLIIQIICIIYWWNPIMYLLRDILSHSLELKCDSYISKDLNTKEKVEYLNTLIHTIEASSDNINKFLVTSSFGNQNQIKNIKQRFEMVFDYDFDLNKNKTLSIVFAMLLFIITYSITIQSAYIPSIDDYLEDDGSGLVIDMDTAYIINLNEAYYLYYGEDEFYELTPSQLHELLNVGIKIKNSKGVLK